MLDEGCGLICSLCPGGEDPAQMQEWTAGLLTAFLRGTLQGEIVLATLEDVGDARGDDGRAALRLWAVGAPKRIAGGLGLDWCWTRRGAGARERAPSGHTAH